MNLRLCIFRLFLANATLISFLPISFADEFTSPSNSLADLTTSFTIGQNVQLAWESALETITLIVAHWGGDDVGGLLSAAANPGVWNWRVGQSDNINEDELEKGLNYVLILRDPSGGCPNAVGWVNCQLQSRAFKIRSNIISSSSSSSSSSSTLSPSSSATPSASTSSMTGVSTTSAAGTAQAPAVGLGTGIKAGIGVGAGLGGLLLVGLGVAVAIFCTKRAQKQVVQYSRTNTSNTAPEVFQVGVHHQPQQGGYSLHMFKPSSEIPRAPIELPAEPGAELTYHELDISSLQQRK